MIKNIIFDVGKVLVEWEPYEAFRRLGFSEEIIKKVAAATVDSPDWNESDRSVCSDEEQLDIFISKAPDCEKEIRLFWENIGMAIRQYDYAKDWIRSFKEKGYHCYILSNYARWTYWHTQEQLSFLKDADGALFSFEAHQIKPEPEIYQTLFQKFDLNPEECLFFDDRAENIQAAKAQGMEGIVFTTREAADVAMRDFGIQ